MSTIRVNLGKIATIRTGKLDANASSNDGAYPFFTCAKTPLRISSYSYDCECVLVAGNGDLNVKHYKGKFDAYQRTYIIEALSSKKDQTHLRYVYHFLETYLETLREKSIGGIIKYIKLGNLSEAQIPLPPLAEQKRIAGILDAADALRAKRRESLAQLDTLLQSTFLDMFGDPVTNPKEWEIFPLRSVGELENGDRSSNYPSGSDILDSGVLFLSTKNISGSRLIFGNSQFISEEKFKSLNRGKLRRKDLVITLRGTLGNCAIFDCEFETGFINAQILIIHPIDSVSHIYLHALLVSDRMKRHFQEISTGVAVKQLTGKQIGDLLIPIPPLPRQQQFAEIVTSVERQKSRLRAHLAELDTLFASLQSRAFRGEL